MSDPTEVGNTLTDATSDAAPTSDRQTNTKTPTISSPSRPDIPAYDFDSLARRPFKELLADERLALQRHRLAMARARKAELRASGEGAKPKPRKPHVRQPLEPLPTPHTKWTEKQWQTSPLTDCKTRLALLKEDFTLGSETVGKREDINNPKNLRCFVCNAHIIPVTPKGGAGWVWKQDYINRATGLWESVLIDTQQCFNIYANDTRMRERVKDLVNGRAADQQPTT